MAKILVIDDEEGIRNLLGRFLKAENHEASFASNGIEGLEQARAVLPDLILLDMKMPVMDGLSLFAMLKKDPRTSAIPILFLTSDDKISTIDDAMRDGASGYITKPFDLSRLASKMASFL